MPEDVSHDNISFPPPSSAITSLDHPTSFINDGSGEDPTATSMFQRTLCPRFYSEIRNVLQRRSDIFNGEVFKCLRKVLGLSTDEQYLLMRLICRQAGFIKRSNINYPSIDVESCLQSLRDNELLDDSSKLDIEHSLHLLSLDEIKKLSLNFGFKPTGSKKTCAERFLKCLRTMSSLSSMEVRRTLVSKWITANCSGGSRVNDGTRQAIAIAAIASHPVAVHVGLNTNLSPGWSGIFSTLLWSYGNDPCPHSLSDAYYPFKTVNDLDGYYEGLETKVKIMKLQTEKKHREVVELMNEHWDEIIQRIQKDSERLRDCNSFEQRYSVGAIHARILVLCTDSLEKTKQHLKSAKVLRCILDSQLLKGRRGKMWNRLCLLEDRYLKSENCDDRTLEAALADEFVVLGDRLGLEKRRSVKYWNDVVAFIKETHISALSTGQTTMTKNVYVSNSVDGTVKYMGVEAYTLEYYLTEHAFTNGIHSEGSLLSTLFELYFADVIHAETDPSMFIDSLQTSPLDLKSSTFRDRRHQAVVDRLALLDEHNEETWKGVFSENWLGFYDKTVDLIKWDLFGSKEECEGCIAAFRASQLAALFNHILDHRLRCFSGVPDLFLWTRGQKEIMFVEVKSPNDRLSDNQIIWLNKLSDFGIKNEVARISNGIKRINIKTDHATSRKKVARSH